MTIKEQKFKFASTTIVNNEYKLSNMESKSALILVKSMGL